jgi:predicted  nucleic acid-binding Zn-ribbon protein
VIALVATWAASALGAILFFCAGAAWARRRAPAVDSSARHAAAERDRLAEALTGAQAELDRIAGHTRADLERAMQARSDAERIASHGQVELGRLGAQLRSAVAQLDRSTAEARAMLVERDRLADELRKAQATLEPLARKARLEEDRAAVRERALAAVQAERQKLTAELAAWETRAAAADGDLRAVSAARDRLAAEVDGVRARLDDTERQLDDAERRAEAAAAPRPTGDAAVDALRHELTLCEERARAHEVELDRLREELARLRMVETYLEQTRRESVRLVEEVRTLRAAAFAGRRPRRFPHATPVPIPTTGTRGDAFQSILDRETRHGNVHSVAIADELGLVVASTGAHGDALAAFGAYLAEVGAKTREVLPLSELRQVTVRDDRDVTLTVRPLETTESNLALVVLAVGDEHDRDDGEGAHHRS